MTDKFNYFKVSDKLLNADIKKSELWVYLTHSRHRGLKSKGYSIAGLNAVVKIFGNSIDKKVYDKCINSLIEKDLIKYADEEVKKGFYKTDKAIEIIEGKTNIQIPTNLLDKKIITNLKVYEIKDIIKLYSLYDPLGSYGGLDYNYMHAINSNHERGVEFIARFGGGFSRVIYDKRAYKIPYPNKYIKDDDFNISINKYIDMKLFKFKPVIIEVDPDDEDLSNIKHEVFDNLVSFSNADLKHKYISTLEENEKAIYIIEPLYPVRNKPYEEYLKYRGQARQRAIDIYSSLDDTTNKEIVKKYIYNHELYEYIENHLLEREDININEILNLLEEKAINRYKIDSIDSLKEEIDLIHYEVAKEKTFIVQENERISKETGKRRRHTTSPRLRELKENINHLENIIDNIERIEKKLIELIPNWIIDKLIENENNRDDY